MQKQTDKTWFQLREKRLTASTFGSAIGVAGAYESRAELWRLKTGRTWKDTNPFMQFGVVNEKRAKSAYEDFSGHLSDDVYFNVHRDHNWLGASPDGIIDGVALHEIKCKPADPYESISPQHMAQIQGQLACAELERSIFQSWTPEGQRIWEVKYSNKYWEWMFPYLEEFWEFVMTDQCPPRLRKKRSFNQEIETRIIYEDFSLL